MADDNRELTFGGRAAGLSFNPSGNQNVQELKQQAANFIDECHDLQEATSDPDVKRMYALAITNMQQASMWAVKAATWQS